MTSASSRSPAIARTAAVIAASPQGTAAGSAQTSPRPTKVICRSPRLPDLDDDSRSLVLTTDGHVGEIGETAFHLSAVQTTDSAPP